MAYAISSYNDDKEIYAKLAKIISEPARPVAREALASYLKRLDDECPK